MNFFINEAMGIGNSGVEHAQFYRAKRFDQVHLPYKFIFNGLVENLHEAMDYWNLKDDQVISIWEYFVFGDEYIRKGLKKRVEPQSSTTIDETKTSRITSKLTESNMWIIRHLIKYPDSKNEGLLLVSTNRVEFYDNETNRRKIMYEELPNPHGKGAFEIRNIHLYDQPEAKHLFFANLVELRRYFFHKLEELFPGENTFIIDRGEETEVALMDEDKNPNRRIIDVVHADHLSDRDDPKNPLWNNFYEYALTHLSEMDKLVVATELQREDLLIDFPNEDKKIVAIPVGGVDDVAPDLTENDKHEELRLITMSRLADEKHIDLIVQAVINLHQAGARVSLDIYGEGSKRKKLTDLIKDNQAENYIELKGLTHHANQIYPQYDAFVSASYSEGFGLTYIEALNAGLPVITFNARFGAMEMIQDGENGYAYEFKRNDSDFNIKQLEAGITKMIDTDIPKMQVAVLKSVEKYRDHVIAEKWRTLIDEL